MRAKLIFGAALLLALGASELSASDLNQLVADYRGYGLPLPPDDAKLVKFESGGRGTVNGELAPPTYFLGFLLRPASKDSGEVLLVGTAETHLRPHIAVELVEPKPELIQSIDLQRSGGNLGLAVALQCQARGWNALAQELWTSSLKFESGYLQRGAFYQPANLPDQSAVAYLAWAYCGCELGMPNTERTKTAKRMKAILTAEPRLNTESNQRLLKSLEAALVPSTAKPGTVEWMIDDLTEMCDKHWNPDETDPRYSRLAEMGFAAVPALIEHLDDDRLTRTMTQRGDNYPIWIDRVEDVVSDLLQDMAGEDDEKGDDKTELHRKFRSTVAKAAAQAWWDKARKVGEEAYFVAHVLPPGGQQQWPNSVMLETITKKYPQQLPKLYLTILDKRENIVSWPVAKAITKSSLPDLTKRALFLRAASHVNLEHRRYGLQEIQKLDSEEFMKILLATLESLPRTATQPYWKCPEAAFAHTVMATDDPRAWTMLEKIAKRSDVGLRMEFMNPMNYIEEHQQQRLDFLTSFLDDAESPDVDGHKMMFDGPYAGFQFRRLEVRNLAAMKIAYILKMPDEPDMAWTPDQWQKLRDQIKERLKK